MSKLKASLFGFRADGRLGKDLTFAHTKQGTIVKQRPTHLDAQTLLQLAQRTTFENCVGQWHTLTPAEKEVYRLKDPRLGGPSSYLNFMRECLLGVPPMEIGEGHITLLPADYDSIVQGAWAITLNTIYYLNTQFVNISDADGDSFNLKAYLSVGTYTLLMYAQISPFSAIIDFDIDGVEVASFDMYSVGTVRTVRFTQVNIAVATASLKTIKARVDGRDPASANWYAWIECIALWRTA